MPINQPYKERSIVDDALAFNNKGRTGGSGTTLYQSELSENVTNTQTTIIADKQYVNRVAGQTMANVANAERRAKGEVGEFHEVTEWDINDDVTLRWGSWSLLPFQNEVLRAQGVECNERFNPTRPAWYHIIQSGQEGEWWYFAMIALATPGTVVDTQQGYLAFLKNGAFVRIVDIEASTTYNETDVENLILKGGCHIDVKRGDRIEVQFFLRGTGTGDITFGYPTSVYGYVTGSRQSCEYGRINSPVNGTDFVPS